MKDADEPLTRKLRALLEMSRRGTPNEAEIAADRLDHLLRKHGLTLDAIDPANRSTRWFKYRTQFDQRLLQQVCALVLRTSQIEAWATPNRREIGFDLTPAEWAEVDRLYAFYRKELEKEFERCYRAFVHVNSILAPASEEAPDLTKEEMAELMRILSMARTMNSRKPHHQISAKGK